MHSHIIPPGQANQATRTFVVPPRSWAYRIAMARRALTEFYSHGGQGPRTYVENQGRIHRPFPRTEGIEPYLWQYPTFYE